MARGARPLPAGFNHELVDRLLDDLGLRSVDAVAAGLHWGYLTSLRKGELECPGAKMLPSLADFLKVKPRELYAISDKELTVCHRRHFMGWSMSEAAAAREWKYGAYKVFELGEPLSKEQSTSASWARTARVFQVSPDEMRAAWQASNRLSIA